MAEPSISNLIWGSTASFFTAPHQSSRGVQKAAPSFMDGFAGMASAQVPRSGTDSASRSLLKGITDVKAPSSNMGYPDAQSVLAEAQNSSIKPPAYSALPADEPLRAKTESLRQESLSEPGFRIDPTHARTVENPPTEAAVTSKGAHPEPPAGADRSATSAREDHADSEMMVAAENTETAAEGNEIARPETEEEANRPSTGGAAFEYTNARPDQGVSDTRDTQRQSGKKERNDATDRIGNSGVDDRKSAKTDRRVTPNTNGGRSNGQSNGRPTGVSARMNGNANVNRADAGQSSVGPSKSTSANAATPQAGSGGSLHPSAIGEGGKNPRTIGKNQEASANPADGTAKTTPKLPSHVRGVMAMTHSRGGHLTMKLHPESLGALRVQMSVNQGQVSIQFHTQTAEASAMIRDSIESLRSALESQGFRLDHVSIQPLSRVDGNGQAGESRNEGKSPTEHDAGGEQSRGFREEESDGSPAEGKPGQRPSRSFAARLDAHARS